MQKGKELNDIQRNPLDIEILSNLRFGSLEIRDTSVIVRYLRNLSVSLLEGSRTSDLRFLPSSCDLGLPFQECHDANRGKLEKKGVRILSFYDAL